MGPHLGLFYYLGMDEERKNLEDTLREQIEKKGYELIEIEQHSLRKGLKMILFIDPIMA